MDACMQLTDNVVTIDAAGDLRKLGPDRRRTYMREYMRRRRAASGQGAPPESEWTREFQALSPTVQAAITVEDIDRQQLDFASSDLDTGKLCDELVRGLKSFHYGDIRGLENGLYCQGNTLNRIFNLFVRRACREGSLEYRDMEFRIAFRAQSQYRATLATLAAVKNPARVAFVNQANIAHGPQQVNNAEVTVKRKPKNRRSKQSGRKRELLPNPRASATKGAADSPMEAVGAIDGTKVGGG
jgi:hypothetical protein